MTDIVPLSVIWDDLSLNQKNKLLSYVKATKDKDATMATLPFLNIVTCYWAIPLSDSELWRKLRPHTRGAGPGRGSE